MTYKCRECGNQFDYDEEARWFNENVADELYRMGETYDKYFKCRLCCNCALANLMEDVEDSYDQEWYGEEDEEDYA